VTGLVTALIPMAYPQQLHFWRNIYQLKLSV